MFARDSRNLEKGRNLISITNRRLSLYRVTLYGWTALICITMCSLYYLLLLHYIVWTAATTLSITLNSAVVFSLTRTTVPVFSWYSLHFLVSFYFIGYKYNIRYLHHTITSHNNNLISTTNDDNMLKDVDEYIIPTIIEKFFTVLLHFSFFHSTIESLVYYKSTRPLSLHPP